MRFQCRIVLIYCIGSIGIFPLPGATASECTPLSIRECLSASTFDQFDVYHLDDDVPTWNDSFSRLKQRCQAYSLFASCVQPITSSCNSSTQMALEGLDNAYQYLCTSSGITDYESNQSCFINSFVRQTVKDCNATYTTKLSTLSYGDTSVSLYCRYVDDYIDCLSVGIKSQCGGKAAKWQSDWIRSLRKPEMQVNKCPGWVVDDSSTSVWATALLVALALTTGLMIVGIITLVIFIIRKRMLRERLRLALNGSGGADGSPHPLPPPYSIVVETPGPDGQMQPHLVDSLTHAPQEEERANRNIQGPSSVPFKVPILPPPYYERTEECAPPYYEALDVTPGQRNDGFVGEEGGQKPEEIEQGVITLAKEFKADISDA